jgi:orotidine-5'-phosphate decarboxylase
MTFREKFTPAAEKNNSWLCLGLDLDPEKVPEKFRKNTKGLLEFCGMVVEATKDLVSAYKPNIAFFEALGAEGLELLGKTMALIPSGIPVILDAKRGDIGNTSAKYAKAAFEGFGADAVTVNPYMGSDCVEPFLSYKDKFVFLLVLTSNKGAADFEQLRTADGESVYMKVAAKIKEWNRFGNLGAVIGATKAADLGKIRELLRDEIFLVPGLGTQGGDLDASVKNCFLYNGLGTFNVARDILYAGPSAEDIRAKAVQYRDLLNRSLKGS